ncbi:MAG: LuxR C-terminal-related transcriptional regulator [Pseudomonadota bacterium]|nr:LuxR C-terminal-related transcriptional regulator [Pseudomonadota bacterium]
MTQSCCEMPLFLRSTLAMGTDEFPRHLINALRATGGVDHLLIHAFDGFGKTTLCLSAGMLGETAFAYSRRYVRGIYTMDPFYPEISALRPGDCSDLLKLDGDTSWVYKSQLMEPCDIGDILAIGFALSQVTLSIQFFRTGGQTFSGNQADALRSCIRLVAELISKHSALSAPPPGLADVNVEELIEGYTASANVSGREEEICKGIIGGSSSIQIASGLNISVNTVLTYRKRLYQRLGISTQHELFERVLSDVLDTTALAS